jgi:hypothetical protein
MLRMVDGQCDKEMKSVQINGQSVDILDKRLEIGSFRKIFK